MQSLVDREKTTTPSYSLCLNILKFKGQQVEKQRDEIEMLGKYVSGASASSSSLSLSEMEKYWEFVYIQLNLLTIQLPLILI